MSDATKMFPILRGQPIPWEVIEPFDYQAQSNHCGQTLKRLAERGGLGPCEAVAVLEERPWKKMDQEAAKRRLREIVEAHANSPLQVALRERDRLREERDALKADRKELLDAITKASRIGGFDGPDEGVSLLRNVESFHERCREYWHKQLATLRGLLVRAKECVKFAEMSFCSALSSNPPSGFLRNSAAETLAKYSKLAAEIESTLEGK